MENRKISVVIPMYYEEEVANECYERIKKVLKDIKGYDKSSQCGGRVGAWIGMRKQQHRRNEKSARYLG